VFAGLARDPYDLDALTAARPSPPGPVPTGSIPPAPARRDVPWRRDALAAIPPPEYFAALCGVPVPPEGGLVRCPLPGHDDAHPSCMVYASTAQGWRCFSHPGGAVGGRIYDLASALDGGPTGRSLRGPAFRAARDCARAALSNPGAPAARKER